MGFFLACILLHKSHKEDKKNRSGSDTYNN